MVGAWRGSKVGGGRGWRRGGAGGGEVEDAVVGDEVIDGVINQYLGAGRESGLWLLLRLVATLDRTSMYPARVIIHSSRFVSLERLWSFEAIRAMSTCM